MNLLFDLGGVIIDLTRDRCIEAFKRLGLANAEDYFGLYAQSGPFMALEDGSIDTATFHRFLRSLLPAGTTDAQIDEAFEKFIAGIPLRRLRALERLRAQGHKIYLLSNTNPIMWEGIIARLFKGDGHDMDYYFDGTVTSFEALGAKPDAAIFRYACRKLGLNPAVTVFFDDSQANVEAAAALGFKAVHVPPGTEFEDLIPDR